MDEIAKRLTLAREKLGLTRDEAAKALGIPYQTYAGHENGNGGFKVANAAQYCRKFKMSLDWLILGRGKGPGETDEALDELLDSWGTLSPEEKTALLGTVRAFAARHRAA